MNEFPDLTAALIEELSVFAETGEETPDDFEGRLPFIRIVRTGGSSNRFEDYPVITFSTFAGDRTSSRNLSATIEAYMQECLRKRGGEIGGVFVDAVGTDLGPDTLPNNDENMKQWNSVLRFTVRRLS